MHKGKKTVIFIIYVVKINVCPLLHLIDQHYCAFKICSTQGADFYSPGMVRLTLSL